MMPSVIPLHAAETEAAVALWHACGLTRPWNDPRADLARALAGPSSTVLAAHVDGSLAGTAIVGHDGHRGWVYYLAVAPAHRRAGIGAALMRAAEGWLAEHGLPRLNLMVRADNLAAAAFYEALGYRRSDVTVFQRDL